MPVPLVLNSIFVYPLKSARGLSVSAWNVGERGLEFDRRWMVVDSEYKFLTQRQIPRLALISAILTQTELVLDAQGMNKLSIPLARKETPPITVRVWDDTVQAELESNTASQWLSDFLHVETKLVFMPDRSQRHVHPKYTTENNPVGFADAFPFLVLSEASLEELNRRLDRPLPMNRFRPNLVVSGCSAFAEDDWKEIKIGTVELHFAKPCSRCATTTVDQATGIAGKEPLKTLATFRQRDGKVYFGQNAVHRTKGVLTVGQSVEVVEQTSQRHT